MTPPADHAAIRARVQAATPGPWSAGEMPLPFNRQARVCSVDKLICVVGNSERGAQDEWEANAALIANAPADLTALLAERDEQAAEVERLRAERNAAQFDSDMRREDTETVARIWIQLGSPTYEQLAGRSIYDLIDEMKAQITALTAALEGARAAALEDAAKVAEADDGLVRANRADEGPGVAQRIASAIRALISGRGE